MKKSRIFILIALLLIVSLGAFYVYKINIFDENTLKTIDIRTGDFTTPSVYSLERDEAKKLFSSLSSVIVSDLDDTVLLDGATEFDMTILNRWDLTHNYRIFFTESKNIYMRIDNEKALYEVEDPSFFYSHVGFDALYSNLQFPSFNISINQTAVPYTVKDPTWSFKKLDETWKDVTPVIETTTEGVALLNETTSTFGLGIDKTPSEATLKIIDTKTAQITFEGPVNIGDLPVPEHDGTFSYELGLTWNDADQDYKGFATITIPVEVDLPESFAISKETVMQGDMIVVSALHVNDFSKLNIDQNIVPNFKWFATENGVRAYLPTSYSTEIGKHSIKFTNTETAVETTLDFEVVSRAFKVQRLEVDTTVEANTRTDEAYEEYRNVFNPARTVSNEERYYTEPFVLPTKGRLNTEFGESRTVNGAATSYRHNGIDIGAKRYVDVVATNAGKVVLARNLILTGNTIVIDHGEGLFSVYEHLDSLAVTEGNMVTQSQYIAEVGSTGFSTGPHLHFMISYYDINLEPGYFIYGEALTKENYADLMK